MNGALLGLRESRRHSSNLSRWNTSWIRRWKQDCSSDNFRGRSMMNRLTLQKSAQITNLKRTHFRRLFKHIPPYTLVLQQRSWLCEHGDMIGKGIRLLHLVVKPWPKSIIVMNQIFSPWNDHLLRDHFLSLVILHRRRMGKKMVVRYRLLIRGTAYGEAAVWLNLFCELRVTCLDVGCKWVDHKL